MVEYSLRRRYKNGHEIRYRMSVRISKTISHLNNGTFKLGYLKELECYLRKHHPNSGLKGEPRALSKIRYWKKCYASIAMLKSRSGLGFQYTDGAIIVDDPKFWDDFLKVINTLLKLL